MNDEYAEDLTDECFICQRPHNEIGSGVYETTYLPEIYKALIWICNDCDQERKRRARQGDI